MEEKKPIEDQPLVRSLDNNDMTSSIFTKNLFIFLILAIVIGGVSGYVLSGRLGGGRNAVTSESINSSNIAKGTVVGSDDTKIFKDTAIGDLKDGGIEGEGQFHLVRPGGESQNVYLTSSIVDLSKFVGKKLKVWGATQNAQYAGWLMDVGKVEVL